MTTVVVGLGGMGSAALYHLARRGENAVGFEQFGPANLRGASHGRTRVIRQAYFEDARYVPLLKRAYELWEQLNRDAVEPIWRLCGGVAIGKPDAALIAGNIASSNMHGIAYTVYDATSARHEFPDFLVRDDEVAVFEPTVGALFPERCVAEHLRRAVDAGAQARFGVAVERIAVRSAHVTIRLADGSSIDADRVVLTAGPWIRDFADLPIRIERNVQHWFNRGQTTVDHVFMIERDDLPRLLYGFPDFGEGIKAAFHHSGDFIAHASEHSSDAHDFEVQAVREALHSIFARPLGMHVRSEPCMYAVTPDEHFIIGPGTDDRVVVAGGFSGHGFKFCSVVGEVLADLVIDGSTKHDIAVFSPRRTLSGSTS